MSKPENNRDPVCKRRDFIKRAAGAAGAIGILGTSSAEIASATHRITTLKIGSFNGTVNYDFRVSSPDLSGGDGNDNINNYNRYSTASGTVYYGNTDTYTFSGWLARASASKYSSWDFNGGFAGTYRDRIKITTSSNSQEKYTVGVTGDLDKTGSIEQSDYLNGGYAEGYISGGYQDIWRSSGQINNFSTYCDQGRVRLRHY